MFGITLDGVSGGGEACQPAGLRQELINILANICSLSGENVDSASDVVRETFQKCEEFKEQMNRGMDRDQLQRARRELEEIMNGLQSGALNPQQAAQRLDELLMQMRGVASSGTPGAVEMGGGSGGLVI